MLKELILSAYLSFNPLQDSVKASGPFEVDSVKHFVLSTKNLDFYVLDSKLNNIPREESSVLINYKPSNTWGVDYNGDYVLDSFLNCSSIESCLKPDIYLSLLFNLSEKVDGTLFLGDKGFVDVDTYLFKDNDYLFYFFDKNSDGKLNLFIDGMQIIKVNKNFDNTGPDNISINYPLVYDKFKDFNAPRQFYHYRLKNEND